MSIPQEHLNYFKTPEYRAKIEKLVAEPGQKGLVDGFITLPMSDAELSFILNEPLSDLEVEVLVKQDKEAPDGWEEFETIEERGPDVSHAHGLLTYRGLITWIIKEGKNNPWLYCILTDAGEKLKDQILNTD